MARRAFEVIDVVEILQHWHAGRSKADVAASVGVDRGTVRKYVAPAEAAGLAPGGPRLSRGEWVDLVRGWFPELVDAKARSLTFPEINAHRDRIELMLATNTVTTVHQRLRDEHSLAVGISSFRRYVWLEFPDVVSADAVTVWRPPVEPGSEAQIDYGYLGSWFDPIAKRARRVWAFVMVLACSRHMFVRPVLRMDQRSWVAAHVGAFEFFAGVPARLVPDNLKTGVIKADLYDPKMNRAYAEMAAHYGCLIDPARASKPKDKPRVERAMPYVRDSFWRGRDWDDIEHMQSGALAWCTMIAGRRRHRSLDGAEPAAVFGAVEADALMALPVEPFELAAWSTPKVHPDCHVKVGKALYSVPWAHIGRQVDAREADRVVEVFLDGTLIKTHARVEREGVRISV
jgi:transposase